MNPFHALMQLIQGHAAQQPQQHGQPPDITYNPNPNTNIPYSTHNIPLQVQQQHSAGNLGVPYGHQPQGYSQVQHPGPGAYNPGAIPLQGSRGVSQPQTPAYNTPQDNFVHPNYNPQIAPTQQYWN